MTVEEPWAPSWTAAPTARARPGFLVLSDVARADAVEAAEAAAQPWSVEAVAGAARRIVACVEAVVDGKPEAVRVAVAVLLAEGHLLIEDVPGVGKTLLAKALARALGVGARRIQFTPDLLPGDVTGVSVYDPGRRDFEFKPGAVFAHVVIGDEINRASPKTQSALLECMEERQVSVDGVTYPLRRPFFVVATQNPVEMEGTYPLPEAQRDRFMARIAMGYPAPAAELLMLDSHAAASPLDTLEPVSGAAEVSALADAVRSVYVAPELRRYIIDVVSATRWHPELRLGASPRASLHLLRVSRAAAALDGRSFVIPDDIQAMARPVLAHRLLLAPDAGLRQHSGDSVITEVVARVPVPGLRGPRHGG